MRYPADYHLHTPLCRHATGEPEAYATRALEIGLTEIGFSDHSPMPQDGYDNWRMLLSELEEYVAKVRRVQKDFPRLTVRLALEVDYIPGCESWVRDLAARYPWDYFIGSVHYVAEGWDVDNPAKKHLWHERDSDEIWSIYFERLICAVESKLFDYIAHPDLPKKFNIYPKTDCLPWFQNFLRAAHQHQIPFEINTGGLRKDCREMYPSTRFLRLASEYQLPIVFGSDAHAPEEVGDHFAEAVQLARHTGFTHCCRFVGRQRELVPLPMLNGVLPRSGAGPQR